MRREQETKTGKERQKQKETKEKARGRRWRKERRTRRNRRERPETKRELEGDKENVREGERKTQSISKVKERIIKRATMISRARRRMHDDDNTSVRR